MTCPVAIQCGGCPLIVRSRQEQAELKLARVRAALEAGFRGAAAPKQAQAITSRIAWAASPSDVDYRNRVRMRIGAEGDLEFFNGAKSGKCAVLAPELRRGIASLQRELEEAGGAFRPFSHVEVRGPGLDGRPSAYFARRDGHSCLDASTLDAISRLRERGWWVDVADSMGGEGAAKAEGELVVQRFTLGDIWWDVPLGTFMQINSAVNDLLVEHAVVGAAWRGLEQFADVFSGAGNFGLPLASTGLRGIAVESDYRAAQALRRSAESQCLAGLSVWAGNAHAWAEDAIRSGASWDLVVLDPPRAGLKGNAPRFAALARRHILLCSCNPNTLASDLRALVEARFLVESVTAFDMFPATEHVEVAVWLRRG